MNDDFSFELRTSWRQFDVPDQDQALRAFEREQSADQLTRQSLIDQATGILMALHRTDGETVRRLLLQVARTARVTATDLARAVIDLATGATTAAGPRAVEAAKARLLPSVIDRSASAPAGARHAGGTTAHRNIDLRDAAKPPVAGTS